MARLELQGRIKHLHRLVTQEKSPFVVQVELDCASRNRLPFLMRAKDAGAVSYQLEFFVDDETASRLRPDRPVHISLSQD